MTELVEICKLELLRRLDNSNHDDVSSHVACTIGAMLDGFSVGLQAVIEEYIEGFHNNADISGYQEIT